MACGLLVYGDMKRVFPAFPMHGTAFAALLALGCSGQSHENSPANGGTGGAGASAGDGGGGSAPTAGTAGTRSFTPDPGCTVSGDCTAVDPPASCLRFGDGPGVCQRPIEPVS